MKTILLTLFILWNILPCSSQHVGLGTTTPTYPLTLPSVLGDKISFWGGDGAPNANHYGIGVQSALMQIFTISGGDIAFGTGRSAAFTENARITGLGEIQSKGAFAGYTFFDRNDLTNQTKRFIWYNSNGTARLFSGTIGDIFSIKHNGFVGIGVADPQAKLHLNGAMRIADGTQGAGKVLTSDANGTTSWNPPALTNSERFLLMYKFGGTAQPNQWMIGYEVSPDISIATNTGIVTINKTGLYHFEVGTDITTVISVDLSQFSSSPELFTTTISIDANNVNVDLAVLKTPFLRESNITNMSASGKGSLDIWIVAPATLKIQTAATNPSRTFNSINFNENYFTGYLISQ